MNIQVRAAEVEDAAIVALLGRLTFSETFGHLFEDHVDDLADYLQATFNVAKIRHSLGESERHYWVAFADDLPVGYAKLKYPSSTKLLPHSNLAQLQKIYVLRDFLALGLGLPLLDALLERARSLSAQAIWLSVLRENERAIRFYCRHGFELLGPDIFTIGEQAFGFDVLTRHL